MLRLPADTSILNITKDQISRNMTNKDEFARRKTVPINRGIDMGCCLYAKLRSLASYEARNG